MKIKSILQHTIIFNYHSYMLNVRDTNVDITLIMKLLIIELYSFQLYKKVLLLWLCQWIIILKSVDVICVKSNKAIL